MVDVQPPRLWGTVLPLPPAVAGSRCPLIATCASDRQAQQAHCVNCAPLRLHGQQQMTWCCLPVQACKLISLESDSARGTFSLPEQAQAPGAAAARWPQQLVASPQELSPVRHFCRPLTPPLLHRLLPNRWERLPAALSPPASPALMQARDPRAMAPLTPPPHCLPPLHRYAWDTTGSAAAHPCHPASCGQSECKCYQQHRQESRCLSRQLQHVAKSSGSRGVVQPVHLMRFRCCCLVSGAASPSAPICIRQMCGRSTPGSSGRCSMPRR